MICMNILDDITPGTHYITCGEDTMNRLAMYRVCDYGI